MVSSTEHTEKQSEENITEGERWPDEITIGTETPRSSASAVTAVRWASFLFFFSVCSVYSVVKSLPCFEFAVTDVGDAHIALPCPDWPLRG